jgi:hypothetical protein
MFTHGDAIHQSVIVKAENIPECSTSSQANQNKIKKCSLKRYNVSLLALS